MNVVAAKALLSNKKVRIALAGAPLFMLMLLVGFVVIVGAALSTGSEEASASECPSISANGTAFPTNGPINVGDKLTGRKNMILTAEMMFFAQAIVAKGQEMSVSTRGLVISIATALQESTLHNYPGGDRDSAGLFQQRPSQGWGTIQQVTQPSYAAQKFFEGLLKVKNWETLPLTDAAQKVQKSGYPDAYAKWESDAAGIVESILGATSTPQSTVTSTTEPYTGPATTSVPGGEEVQSVQKEEDGKCVNNLDAIPASYSGTNGDTSGISGPVGVEQTTIVGKTRVNITIAPQVQAMFAAAQAAGLNLGGRGFRDSASQIATRRNNCGSSNYAIYQMPASSCSPPTAKPGTSMHERGLAIDFTCSGGGAFSFKNSPCFPWMKANAAKFGFYNLPSEPWHWSTNGN